MGRLQNLSGRVLPGLAALALVPMLAVAPAAAAAAAAAPGASPAFTTLDGETIQRLAKAAPDECFAGVGVPYPPGPPCATGQPKVNQSYVWGLARTGPRLWFGTGANVLCLKPAGYNVSAPILNADYTCEFGQSQFARQNSWVPANLGDVRPPEVFTYDTPTGRLTDRTAEITTASAADAQRLRQTAGLRAAGAHNGVVLLGGPDIVDGLDLFAFEAASGRYLGSVNLPQYQDIRHFVEAAGVLYAGVGVGANGGQGGMVLRWTGNRQHPFTFDEVGDLPTQVADLTVHAGRLFVTTWPQAVVQDNVVPAAAPAATKPPPSTDPAHQAGVWMSPPLADGAPGLTTADANGWQQVWHMSEYEPDPVVAETAALGGLASYGGYLYWGTMHVPLQATAAELAVYPAKTPAQAQLTAQNTQRALSIFRGSDLGAADQQVDTLYGESTLPAYDPTAAGGAGAWSQKSTGSPPLYGGSGFGDPFNLYAWTMAVAGGRLYIGTMDFSYIGLNGQLPAPSSTDATARTALSETFAQEAQTSPPTFGSDVWAFDQPDAPATVVDDTGEGNYLNQGVRTMVTDGSTLYLGMANPMNLRTDPTMPEGGWELLRLTR